MTILSANSQDVPSNSGNDIPQWRRSLRDAVRDLGELRRVLRLPDSFGSDEEAQNPFPIFAPREYVARIQPEQPDDPLLLQILPLADESADSQSVAGFSRDPVGDLSVAGTLTQPEEAVASEPSSQPSHLTGLLQKYHGRVLLVTTGACAVHCRYCFRRHFPYSAAPKRIEDWQPCLDLIASDSTISEVIFSGGDPLTLRDEWLQSMVERLAEIPHVQNIRVHTRLPTMIPSRVNEAMLGWLTGTRLASIVVLHVNHANELVGDDIESAIARLADAGVPLLNQTVLLKGVNDSVESLESLSRRLIALRVMPYYLHQLDRVIGAAHFEVDIDDGREIMRRLRRRLPGYLVPRYVQELPGEASKTIIAE